MCWTNVYILE